MSQLYLCLRFCITLGMAMQYVLYEEEAITSPYNYKPAQD